MIWLRPFAKIASAAMCASVIFCSTSDTPNPSSTDNTQDNTQTDYGDPNQPPPESPYKDGNTMAVGRDPKEDGSGARLSAYGTAQYFWGDPGDGTNIPLVKIVTSSTDQVVDAALAFNPDFLDLTYGDASAVNGWNPNRPHTFRDIAISDHVEVAFYNGDGDTVMKVKLDLISATDLTESGYASLGVLGGDGAMITGSPEHILSFGTSMDDNFNMCRWTDTTSSPPTDSVYTPNATWACYQYLAVYRLSIDPAAFGESGFGGAAMTYIHASPAKMPNETITVTEGPPPEPGTIGDPFRFLPPSIVPPDTTTTTPPDTTTTDTTTTDTTTLPPD